MKKERNYYLIGLPIFGALLVAGLGSMIYIAVQNPVEMDSSHMMPYRELDKNYNKIVEMGKKFDENYVVSLQKPAFAKDKSANLELNITDKNGSFVQNASIVALVTRPDTSKHDIKLSEFSKTPPTYVSKPFSVNLEGRWKIEYKIEINGLTKFLDIETFAKKP